MPDYVTSPGVSVSEKFKLSGRVPLTNAPAPPLQLSATPQHLTQQEALPPPISGGDIEGMYQPLLEAAQNQAAPPSRPIPPQLNPWATFAAALAANLGTAMTHNPLFAQQVQENIQQQERQRQAIMDQNAVDQITFSKEKWNRLVTLRANILDKQIDEAIKNNDLDRAEVLTRNRMKLQSELQTEQIKAQGAVTEHTERVRGEEARKTAKFEAGLEKKTSAQKAEPMNMNEYSQRRREVLMGEAKKLPVTQPGWNILGFQTPIGEHQMTQQEALEQFDAAALQGGDEGVKAAAKRNLILSIKQRLGLTGKKLEATDKAAITAELQKYGLSVE